MLSLRSRSPTVHFDLAPIDFSLVLVFQFLDPAKLTRLALRDNEKKRNALLDEFGSLSETPRRRLFFSLLLLRLDSGPAQRISSALRNERGRLTIVHGSASANEWVRKRLRYSPTVEFFPFSFRVSRQSPATIRSHSHSILPGFDRGT